MFVNYEAKTGRRKQNDYEDAVEKGIADYKKDIFRSIPDDESRNDGCHVEASYLCHGIWKKIMKNEFPLSTGNEFKWKLNDNELLFHFDIMNNPNKSKKNVFSCGLFKKCNDELRKQVEDIYHSIGNMAPVPWFKLAGDNYIDIQCLHKSVDERWDILLLILKKNWNEWNKCCGITFEQYMILTCQQPYYEDIYNMVLKEGIDNITLEKIDDWNNTITTDSKIITFNSEEGIDDSIMKIKDIIKIRCKMISILLSCL